MTVRELIEELSKFPPEATVHCCSLEGNFEDVEWVDLVEETGAVLIGS